MFGQGIALGIIIGYGIKKYLDGDYKYESEIYEKGFKEGYDEGYSDCAYGLPKRR